LRMLSRANDGEADIASLRADEITPSLLGVIIEATVLW